MDVLKLPLNRLAELSMENLGKFETLERASKSIVYRQKWQFAGIEVDKVKSYTDFSKIPFLTSKELRNMMYQYPIDEILCSKPAHWFSSSGTTGMPKWLPYGKRDIELFMIIRDRIYDMVHDKKKLRLITVTSPPPFVEDGLATFNVIQGIQKNNCIENLTISLTQQREDIFTFALNIKPNVLLSFPSFATRLAELIEESAPAAARKEFAEKKSIKNLLLYLVTRVKKIHPKDLSKFRWGLFGGEPLDPYRAAIAKLYGLEPFEMYLFTEFMPPTVECTAHNGMHLWLDICLPEIIPESELEKEGADSAYIPKAIPLWEAKKGQRGEYVLTTFGEALPLVRYRFGDLLQIVDTEPCSCGCTHPRIKVPRRSDPTIIALGALRFPSAKLDEKLLTVTEYGKADRWQLTITRDGYRPKLIIKLEAESAIKDVRAFEKEIYTRLLEIDMIKTGLDNKILADPEVKISAFGDEGRLITTAGRVIYEGESQ